MQETSIEFKFKSRVTEILPNTKRTIAERERKLLEERKRLNDLERAKQEKLEKDRM
jgi:hypothetical protein